MVLLHQSQHQTNLIAGFTPHQQPCQVSPHHQPQHNTFNGSTTNSNWTTANHTTTNTIIPASEEELVETLREGLGPIDEQLLATLRGQNSFVDECVEEQFKMNY